MMTESDPLSGAIAREALALLKLYDFSAEATVSLLSESENKIYRVNDPTTSESYVLRVNSGRLNYHTPLSIASELRWLIALRNDTDIVVPKVLPAKDGTLVQTVFAADLDKPRHCVIYSFLSGSEPSEDELVPGFRRLGRIAARMHLHAKSWVPPCDFERPVWFPNDILDDRLS